MRLTLSPEKTHVTHVDDGFDLLGFRIVRAPWRGSKRVAYAFPSKRALREIMHRIKTLTDRSTLNLSLDQLIHALNPILRGWADYHRHNAAKRCFAYISHYLWWRVIRWLRKKYPRLTWKQIRRRCWGRHWTSREGTRLAWPAEVPVTRYRYRGHQIPSPWAATTGTGGPPPRRKPPMHNPASRSATACPVESRMLRNGHVRLYVGVSDYVEQDVHQRMFHLLRAKSAPASFGS